jgi:hypothetical protein
MIYAQYMTDKNYKIYRQMCKRLPINTKTYGERSFIKLHGKFSVCGSAISLSAEKIKVVKCNKS